MDSFVRSPRVLAASLAAAALFAIATPTVDLPGLLDDGLSHPPASGNTFGYNTFVPANTPGATYTDPVFGSTVRRLTTDHQPDDLYGRNMCWNADGTKYFHHGQIIDTATGLVTHTVPTGDIGFDAGFDPVDPNVYYYYDQNEIHRVALSTTSASMSDTVFVQAPSHILQLGGALNWWDASGRYFIVRYGDEPSVHLFDRLDLAAGPYAGGADGSVTIDIGRYVGISPSGKYLVGYDELSRGVSWQIDHASRTVHAPNYFWSLCGDHGAFMSASDGRDYMIVANCSDHPEIWRVDITNNAVGLTPAQQKALPNNQRLIGWPSWDDEAHLTAAARGPFRDWAFLSTEDFLSDTFNSGTDSGGVISPWRPYKQEIIAVNAITGEVRRIAHHRSRSVDADYFYQPRVSTSWGAELVGWASNFNTPGQTDIFAVPFAPAAPIITDVMPTNVTGTTAGIFWTTDQLATSQVEFGLTSAYGNSTMLDATQTSAHLQTLTGLTLGTTYHFRVLSTNVRGLTTASPDATFTTASPPVISAVSATWITGTTAAIQWLTEQPSNSQVEYGLTTSYGSSTPVDAGNSTSHFVSLTGLSSGTTYHYRVKSANAVGMSTASADFTFTTATYPIVSNVIVSNITGATATVSWITDQPSTSVIEYGPTSAYGSTTEPLSTLIFEENFTSDNSLNGQTAPTQTQLYDRGWRDGVADVGTGYKFEIDPSLNKNVMYAHWSTATGERNEPDGGASGIRQLFSGSRDVTMYALVKFHNVENSPHGAHWIRFFNNPSAGDFSPGNIAGQMDLDVSGLDKYCWLYDPTTKSALPEVSGPQQVKGFLLDSGDNLCYASQGKSNVFKDDIWYEIVWYLKASTSGSSPTATSDGQMRVYLRPIGTTPWTTVFNGANFVNSALTSPISAWMIGPYMDRWTADIRHYFSRVAVWSGDAYSDGTLAEFLGTAEPDPTPPTVSTGAPTLVTTHSTVITGLTSTTLYHYRVRSMNAAGLETASADATFTTTINVTNVTVSNIQGAAAAIYWTTDQPADTQIEYGTTTAYGSMTALSTSLILNHGQAINTGLQPATTYFFRVRSKNANGVLGTGTGSFTTAPAAVISAVTVADVQATTARITWTTDLPANSRIEYGPVFYTSITTLDPALVTSHSHTITGLTPGTTYVYQVRSITGQNTLTKVGGFTVTTLSTPVISNVNATNITGASATIGWTTSSRSDSQVEYGLTTAYGSTASVDPAAVTAHATTLTGLTGGTTYHYRVRSTNTAGSATSADFTFTTATVLPPIITGITVTQLSSSSALVTWTTDQGADSQIEYGATTAYGSVNTLDTALVTSHSQTLTGLSPTTIYHFRVRSRNVANLLTTSGDGTIALPPIVSNITISNIQGQAAAINWLTDQPADTQIDYGVTTNYGSVTALNPTLILGHGQAINSGLQPNTMYHFRIRARNAVSALGFGPDMTFTTAPATVIANVAVANMTGTTATITWTTDLPANSRIEYGTQFYTSITALDPALVTAHSHTITGLTPGTTYIYQVRSITGQNTLTKVGGFTVTTPALPVPSAPVVSNAVISNIQGRAVAIYWVTDQPADTQIDYGLTSTYTATTSLVSTLVTNHGQAVNAGLEPATTYHFRIRARNAAGVLGTSADMTFTTAPAAVISNVVVASVASTSATIMWTTDLPSNTRIEYGVINYTAITTLDPALVTSHSQTITGLTPGTTYVFLVRSITGQNTLTKVGGFTFTTPPSQ